MSGACLPFLCGYYGSQAALSECRLHCTLHCIACRPLHQAVVLGWAACTFLLQSVHPCHPHPCLLIHAPTSPTNASAFPRPPPGQLPALPGTPAWSASASRRRAARWRGAAGRSAMSRAKSTRTSASASRWVLSDAHAFCGDACLGGCADGCGGWEQDSMKRRFEGAASCRPVVRLGRPHVCYAPTAP